MAILLAIFLVTYFFIATEKIDKTIAVFLGSAAVVATQQVPYPQLLEKVDLNVLFLLIGMMIIVNILSLTGVFEWVAVTLAQKARGNGIKIVVWFLLVTAVFSAFLDNVTTIILMAPITILISQMLKIPATPILILEAIFANIGGAATLIGDPPNILIASKTGLNFMQFINNLGPAIVVILVVVMGIVILFLRKRFVVSRVLREQIMRAQPERAIVEPKMLRQALCVFTFTLLGFFFGHVIHVDAGIVALCGALIMVLVTKVDLHEMLKSVEWNTILFFVGLFMLIGALELSGVFEILGDQLILLTKGNLLWTALAILWFSAVLSALVDNIPLVIAMLPLIQNLVGVFAVQMGLEGNPEEIGRVIAEPLYWSLALGACLGGNGTLIGASVNVVVAQIARRNKYSLSFWDFTRYGLPIMFVSLLISTVYIRIRYF